MKKAEHIILLAGIAFIYFTVLWQFLSQFLFYVFSFFNNDGMIYYYIMPGFSMFAVIMVLSCAPSVLLLVRNVKNKTGVILSAVSLIINFVFLLWTLFCLFAPQLTKYITYTKLGLQDNMYCNLITLFFEGGGILFVKGYALLIAGSFLSFFKNRKQNTAENENTVMKDV